MALRMCCGAWALCLLGLAALLSLFMLLTHTWMLALLVV